MTTAVLIHGFSGSPASWQGVAGLLGTKSHAPAVCGHGSGSDVPTATQSGCTFEREVDRLALVISKAAPAPRHVAGYSLGGRLALGLLVRHPALFEGAALIGANPGIDGEIERAERRAADRRWARCIEQLGLAEFDRKWSRLPLFESQGLLRAETVAEQRRIRLSHDPTDLAAAMNALSLGVMPNYRPSLSGIPCPVLLIAGGLDTKFVALARQMAGRLPRATLRIVDGVGHNVPLEAPAELASLLNDAMLNDATLQMDDAMPGEVMGRMPRRRDLGPL